LVIQKEKLKKFKSNYIDEKGKENRSIIHKRFIYLSPDLKRVKRVSEDNTRKGEKRQSL
jgi:hypothetical protein